MVVAALVVMVIVIALEVVIHGANHNNALISHISP